MRIRIVLSGGLAGLRREKVVETSALPAAERTAFERLVAASGFFALPAHDPDARPMPDARQLDMEIEDDAGKKHRVRVAEHAAPTAVRDLVNRAFGAAPEGD